MHEKHDVLGLGWICHRRIEDFLERVLTRIHRLRAFRDSEVGQHGVGGLVPQNLHVPCAILPGDFQET
jgi:hypothetical protein